MGGGLSFDHNLMLISWCIKATEQKIFSVLAHADSSQAQELTSLQCRMIYGSGSQTSEWNRITQRAS